MCYDLCFNPGDAVWHTDHLTILTRYVLNHFHMSWIAPARSNIDGHALHAAHAEHALYMDQPLVV